MSNKKLLTNFISTIVIVVICSLISSIIFKQQARFMELIILYFVVIKYRDEKETK